VLTGVDPVVEVVVVVVEVLVAVVDVPVPLVEVVGEGGGGGGPVVELEMFVRSNTKHPTVLLILTCRLNVFIKTY